MGWLRDAWLDAGYRSADALAARMLRPEFWPGGQRIAKRSLGNNLRALDRGHRLSWWRRHGGLVDLLASLVLRDPDELEEALFNRPKSADTESGALRFDFPGSGVARALDLVLEELPPGLPEVVVRPGRWQRIWWRTRDRLSRELVGRWLAARKRARYIRCASWADVQDRLPPSGLVYIELLEVEQPESESEQRFIPDLAGLQVCVAASQPPAPDRLNCLPGRAFEWTSKPTNGWVEVRSSIDHDNIQYIIEWQLSRIPRKQRPSLDDIVDVIRATRLERFFDGPGDVVDFVCAFASTRGRQRPGASELEGWARRRINLRALEHARAAGQSDNPVAERASDVMTALLERVLADGASPWLRGRTRAQWTATLPPGVVRDAGLDEARRIVIDHDTELPTQELRQLKNALGSQPSAIIDTLRKAGLFDQSGRYLMLGRSWDLEALYACVFERELDMIDGRRVGRLARASHCATAVVEHLLRELRAGRSTTAARLLRINETSAKNPDILAACEASVCAIGLARLSGAGLDEELLKAAWSARRHVVVEVGGDRVFPAVPLGSSGSAGSAAMCLALLSLYESCVPDHLADPGIDRFVQGSVEIVDELHTFPFAQELIRGSARLMTRVIEARENVERAELFLDSELVLPAHLYAYVKLWRDEPGERAEAASIASLANVTRPETLMRGLIGIECAFGLTLREVLSHLWSIWAELRPITSAPPIAWIESAPGAVGILWRYGTTQTKAPFLKYLAEQRLVPLPVANAIDDVAWIRWCQTGFSLAPAVFGSAPSFALFWTLISEEALKTVLETRHLLHDEHELVIREGWQRFPEHMLEFVRASSLKRSASLLPASPDECADLLLSIVAGRVGELSSASTAAVSLVIWLQRLLSAGHKSARELLALQRAVESNTAHTRG